jgi:hypothetical protein
LLPILAQRTAGFPPVSGANAAREISCEANAESAARRTQKVLQTKMFSRQPWRQAGHPALDHPAQIPLAEVTAAEFWVRAPERRSQGGGGGGE